MTDTVERFSNRVANYIKYRPDYPREIIRLLRAECGLTRDAIIADVGCGTGISSRMFLENGNRVFGVEPNAAMRDAAVKLLGVFPWFIAVDGTAENTTLQTGSTDIVIAAQAFHWFDGEGAGVEFRRILKPGGRIVLIWNERRLDATPFLIEYEAFLLRFARDYSSVRHDRFDAATIEPMLGTGMQTAAFENTQEFDFEGLMGRMLSASYMPSESDAIFPAMIDELRLRFAKHAENGKIKLLYDTRIYYSQ